MRNREDRWTSVEVKLTEYRREIEEQSQVELKATVCVHNTSHSLHFRVMFGADVCCVYFFYKLHKKD